MTQQLTLVAPTGNWKIDEETRKIGLRGVAAARASLADVRRRQIDADPAAVVDVHRAA